MARVCHCPLFDLQRIMNLFITPPHIKYIDLRIYDLWCFCMSDLLSANEACENVWHTSVLSLVLSSTSTEHFPYMPKKCQNFGDVQFSRESLLLNYDFTNLDLLWYIEFLDAHEENWDMPKWLVHVLIITMLWCWLYLAISSSILPTFIGNGRKIKEKKNSKVLICLI